MKFVLALAMILLALGVSATRAPAQNGNECTTVVLHAVSGIDTDCTSSLNCTSVPPTVRVNNPAGLFTVMMYLKNYQGVQGVQVAFDWPPTWSYGFSLWQCQVGQLSAAIPSAPGPITGTITTAFNRISGGGLAPIGLFVFNSIGTGCLSIIESGFAYGNHVIDLNGFPYETHLLDINEGRVCVGSDGWNTCECQGVTAVESTTWGQIKATY